MTAAPSAAARRRALLLVAGVAAVFVVLVIFIVGRRARRGVEAGSPKRIVVLPFDNLGGAEDDYFADGLADAVRGKLAVLPNLEVIARASSTAYKIRLGSGRYSCITDRSPRSEPYPPRSQRGASGDRTRAKREGAVREASVSATGNRSAAETSESR